METVIKLCIYVILVLCTNLTVGMSKLLTMCQAAFFGIGAYIGAFFLLHFNLPFVVIVLLVMLATGMTGLLVSYASVKLKGDYFILGTIGFQMIVYTILYNWVSVTGGPSGKDGIPSIKLLGLWSLDEYDLGHFIFAIVLTIIILLVFGCLQKSPYGRMLKAIGTDELSANALGRNTTRLKAWTFFISAGITGIVGLFYASFMGYVSRSSFTLDESILLITALFIGGIGSRVWGPVLGAVVVALLPVLLRYVGLPDDQAANLREVIYGIALIVLMFVRPQGLLGDVKLK